MGGTSDDLRYIKSEFTKRAEGIDIDVFFGGGNDPYLQLKALGLLLPCKVSDEVLAGLPGDIAGVPLYDTEFTWYGTAISGFGVLVQQGHPEAALHRGAGVMGGPGQCEAFLMGRRGRPSSQRHGAHDVRDNPAGRTVGSGAGR